MRMGDVFLQLVGAALVSFSKLLDQREDGVAGVVAGSEVPRTRELFRILHEASCQLEIPAEWLQDMLPWADREDCESTREHR